MILKQVISLSKKYKSVVVFRYLFKNKCKFQMIGTSFAVYYTEALPMLDENLICTMWDIPNNEKDKFGIHIFGVKDIMAEVYPGECEMQVIKMLVSFDGSNLMPFIANDEIVFIKEDCLKPLSRCNNLKFYKRSNGSETVVAVKDGLLLVAVICEVDVGIKMLGEIQKLYNGLNKKIGADSDDK